MSCLPYPSFIDQIPNGSERKASLSRCRINPLAMSKMVVGSIGSSPSSDQANKEYKLIYSKSHWQASRQRSIILASDSPGLSVKRIKLEKKEFMEDGIALASKYLNKTLRLDVSIVDVEIVLESSQITSTDGCICSCFLDAGCSSIVIDGTNINAINAAQIPKEYIIASFLGGEVTQEQINEALEFANTISVDTSRIEKEDILDKVDTILSYIRFTDDNNNKKNKTKVIFELSNNYATDTNLIAKISTKCQIGKGMIIVNDPNSYKLRMAYAACTRTDRLDNKAISNQRVVTKTGKNIIFFRYDDDSCTELFLSITSSEVDKFADGRAILKYCNMEDVDEQGVFDLNNNDYDLITHKKSHVLQFDFIESNGFKLLMKQFKRTKVQDILMGRTITVKIRVSVVPVPGNCVPRRRNRILSNDDSD